MILDWQKNRKSIYMFDPEARCVSDADQASQLSVLLPGHQLWQHVAHTENVSEWDLEIIVMCSENCKLYYTLSGSQRPGLNT